MSTRNQILNSMYQFMENNQLMDDIYNDPNTSIYSFSFYNFDLFFKFISSSFNGYKHYVYRSFYNWFYKGICSPICLNPHWMKNKHIYHSMECISSCIYNEMHRYEVNFLSNVPIYMNPHSYKIIVYYTPFSQNQLDVSIRIPSICKKCIYINNTSKFHMEMISNVKTRKQIYVEQCNNILQTHMYSMLLTEPKLVPYILSFFTPLI